MTEERRTSVLRMALGVAAMIPVSALGAVGTFTPGSAAVPPDTPILVDLDVTTEVLGDFDYAYIIIGSNDATDLVFSYDTDWVTAFGGNVTGPFYDSEDLYTQEVTIGGDSGTPVGATTLPVGTLTIDTTGLGFGTYLVEIAPGWSELVLHGETAESEQVTGSFEFTIVPEPAAWVLLVAGGVLIRRRR